MSATLKKYLSGRKAYYCAIAIILVVMVPPLCFGLRDAYADYSGTVIAKGNYWWVPFHPIGWYAILEDSNGHRTKRYVGAVGYAYCDVGSYVVKKKGFGEFPRSPGELTPREAEQLVQRKRQQK